MYLDVLFFHSLFRWPVLAAFVYALYRATDGYMNRKPFLKADNAVRHWTATLAHLQLMLGIVLYTQSPVVRHYLAQGRSGEGVTESLFFGLIHIALMLVAVIGVTVGSALAKRATDDRQKFKTMLLWYGTALLIILIAVPWPFSPLAQRPYFRPF